MPASSPVSPMSIGRRAASAGSPAGRRAQPAIIGLDWRKSAGKPPGKLGRLVIDAPAGMRLAHVEDLLRSADVVVVPVLASVFDEQSTTRFLAKLERIKPIAKGKKGVLLVANRQRLRQRAAQRLLDGSGRDGPRRRSPASPIERSMPSLRRAASASSTSHRAELPPVAPIGCRCCGRSSRRRARPRLAEVSDR